MEWTEIFLFINLFHHRFKNVRLSEDYLYIRLEIDQISVLHPSSVLGFAFQIYKGCFNFQLKF